MQQKISGIAADHKSSFVSTSNMSSKYVSNLVAILTNVR